MNAKKVFISYSHDSPEHSERVLSLAWALRNNGIDVELDQFHNEEIVDWPRWCNEQTSREHSEFVVCVCTAEYKRRLDGHVPPEKGKGVYWEGSLIDDDVYDEKGNSRFIPILLDDETESSIPRFLRGWTHCRLRQFTLNDAGYEHLIRILTGQAGVEKNPLGTIPVLPTKRVTTGPQSLSRADFKADISRIIDYVPAELIGRENELALITDAWDKASRSETKRAHILTFVALGGEGKTSLVAKWVAELAYRDWLGCDAAFAWSFYSQGTSEKTQASSDTFLAEALKFFGDEETAGSAKSAYEKAKRLAHLIAAQRALLILDGVEPLQYAPGPPMDGKLKDDGAAALLKALGATNRGLCVVTTRYSIPDLRVFRQTTAPEMKLARLSREAGVHLLKTLGVDGTQHELEQLVADVKGHALTLNLLGTYLRDAHGGDIRKRDLVKLEEADIEEQSGHAFHVMDAYVRSFETEGEKGMRALSVLRLLGLFDRPATADCLNAFWSGEEIGGLTEPLIGLSETQRNITFNRLEDAGLITVNRNAGADLISLDAHPLLREYFATRVRTHLPSAWRAAHRRLYEYLRDNTREGEEPTLKDLQPLYQAVAHGCQAGLQQEACLNIYIPRILRDPQGYSWRKLGAFGSNLGAVTCFFDDPWKRLSPSVDEEMHGWFLNDAGLCLRALGRLSEALDPLRAGLANYLRAENWKSSARLASNLSELELAIGQVNDAVSDSGRSVTYADRGEDAHERVVTRAKAADALHQAGRRVEAETHFRAAEQIQVEYQANYPMLYSVRGFQYCDLLLDPCERAAWEGLLKCGDQADQSVDEARGGLIEETPSGYQVNSISQSSKAIRAVSQRVNQTLKWSDENKAALLTIALDHLTLGRVALYAAILEESEIRNSKWEIEEAMNGLREAGQKQYLALGLLTRAWLRFLKINQTGLESAQEDLEEAWEIAERGPMRLHMADIHLYRARLFHEVKPYPWNKFPDGSERRGPKDDLADARDLIEQCGYWRRKEELEDAEEAAKNWK